MIRFLALAALLFGFTAPAYCQLTTQTPPAQVVETYEGTEFTNSVLKFVVMQDGSVIMHDAGPHPVLGRHQRDGDRVTITFGNCVYEGTRTGNVLYGMARFTSGEHSGRTWEFRVEVK